MTTLGSLVRRHRDRRGLRQADLAKQLRTTQTAISQWENSFSDNDSRPRFENIAKVFDYPDDMLTWWALDQMDRTEKLISKTKSYKDLIMARKEPSTALGKLDNLTVEYRRLLDELTELRKLIADD